MFRSENGRFGDTRLLKIRNAPNNQNYLKHLTVTNTLYTLNIRPWSSNLTPFCSTARRFRDTKLSKIEMLRQMTPEWPRSLNY